MKFAHYLHEGNCYRAKLRDSGKVTLEVRTAGNPYKVLGDSQWDGERIVGPRTDPKVALCLDTLSGLLHFECNRPAKT